MKSQPRLTGASGPISAGVQMRFHITPACIARFTPASAPPGAPAARAAARRAARASAMAASGSAPPLLSPTGAPSASGASR